MCGIGGYVDPRGALDGPAVLATLASELAHRGPDGDGFLVQGTFGLAHRRLAIIDLSPEAAQPMRVGPIAVVFNGEIYNYRELRDELRREGQQFATASDTEVLARAYLQWGEGFVARLRGMWAFAITDARSQILLCSRDPYGIKPFYYARHSGAFVFASEPTALLRVGVPARANLPISAQYLALGLTDQSRDCFFENVTQLGAGEVMVVGADAVIHRSCTVGGYDDTDATAASPAEFAASLEESVQLHLRSDVPVGTCLSGGLDSSTVAALASSAVRAAGGPRFAAITASSGDPETDERHYAAAVAERCDLIWHVVTPGADEFVREVDDCIRVQGEPFGGPSVYLQYCVMRKARAVGLKVMLDGQGADELLCGYERYVPTWGLEIARSAGAIAAFRDVVRVARHSRPGLKRMAALTAFVLLPPLRRRVIASRTVFLRPEFAGCAQEMVAEISSANSRLLDARLADVRRFSLPALLRYEDRNSMAHSIEARVPYVDRGVVARSLRLPINELLWDGFTKYALRRVAAGILPSEIAWRRGKVGFEPPTRRWLMALRERLQPAVERSSLIRRLCRTVPRLSELPTPLQWRLFNLAQWQQAFSVEVE